MGEYDPPRFWRESRVTNGRFPNFDLRLPPISLWEHRQAVRELRAQGRHTINQLMIFDFVLPPARDHQKRPQKYGQRTQKTGSASPSPTLWSGRPSPTDGGSRGGVERYLGFRGRRRNSIESTRAA